MAQLDYHNNYHDPASSAENDDLIHSFYSKIQSLMNNLPKDKKL